MNTGQLTKCKDKSWIVADCLIQQVQFSFSSFSPTATDGTRAISLNLQRPEVRVVRNHVSCRLLLHGSFLFRREFGLKLIGNGFGDLTLDRENVGEIPVVGLRPKVRVGAGIDQLRVHADTVD